MLRTVLLSSLAAVGLAQEVLVLGKDNYDTTVAANAEGILVEYYAPWCGHCKKLEPEFNKAAQTLFDDGVKIPLGKVDATIESELASSNGVQGYPTLKWVVGGKPSEYDGPRDAAGIVAWVKSMTGKAVTEAAPDADDKFTMTLYAPSLLEDFESVSKANRKGAKWHFVKDSATKVVAKHLAEEAIETTDVSKEALEKFFKDNSFALYGVLDGDSFGTYMTRENGMIWTLLPMTADNIKEVVEGTREAMTGVAKELGTDFSVTWTNTNEFGKVLENMFGITEFPKIVVQTKVGDKKNYIYTGEHTKEAVLAYVNDVKAGKIEATLKSEEVPAEPQADPVKVMVGKNMEALAFSDEKDVMIEVYAPWCGHCKKLEPEYVKVAKKVEKEGFSDIITIAKMDGTQNDSPIDAITWSGFPTIYYVKAGTKSPEKYDGARDAKGIWKWIKKNHSKADYIKEKLSEKTKEKKEEL